MIEINKLDKISINGGELMPLIDIDPNPGEKTFRAVIIPSDVGDLFSIASVTNISVYESNGVVLKRSYTKYDTIQDITVNKSGVYRDEGLNPITAATVIFAKKDIEKAVADLEAEVFPVTDFTHMSVEEYQDWKTSQLGKTCKSIIVGGVTIGKDDNAEHFSLSEVDQMNITSLASIAMTTECDLPYHSDRHQCKIYTYKEIIRLYAHAQAHILYNTTYGNALNTYVRSLNNKTDISQVEYGQEIPDAAIVTEMNTALEQGNAVILAVLNKYDIPWEELDSSVVEDPGEPEEQYDDSDEPGEEPSDEIDNGDDPYELPPEEYEEPEYPDPYENEPEEPEQPPYGPPYENGEDPGDGNE